MMGFLDKWKRGLVSRVRGIPYGSFENALFGLARILNLVQHSSLACDNVGNHTQARGIKDVM